MTGATVIILFKCFSLTLKFEMILFKSILCLYFITRGSTYYIVNIYQVLSYCKTVVYFMMLYRPYVTDEFTVETTFTGPTRKNEAYKG